MSAFHLVPAWKLHSINARAARALRPCVQPTAPAVPMSALPFLTRRVLRIIANQPAIQLAALDRQADLETRDAARATADALVLQGLVQRTGQRSDSLHYTLTSAGLQTLLQSQADADRQLGLSAAAKLPAA